MSKQFNPFDAPAPAKNLISEPDVAEGTYDVTFLEVGTPKRSEKTGEWSTKVKGVHNEVTTGDETTASMFLSLPIACTDADGERLGPDAFPDGVPGSLEQKSDADGPYFVPAAFRSRDVGSILKAVGFWDGSGDPPLKRFPEIVGEVAKATVKHREWTGGKNAVYTWKFEVSSVKDKSTKSGPPQAGRGGRGGRR